MATTFLKELFNILVNRKQGNYYYDSYKKIIEEARKHQKSGKDLTVANDRDFLERLIYEKFNGVAKTTNNTLGENDFNVLISNPDFMQKINAYIKDPSYQKYKELYDKWEEISNNFKPGFARQRANRFAATFNTSLSVLVSESGLNQVYSWFDEHGFFANCKPLDVKKEEAKYTWYKMNERIIDCLKKEFEEELNNDVIDKLWLNMFVYDIWARLIKNPYRLKKQVIKYGPPGTGKTYTAKLDAAREIAVWKAKFEINDEEEYSFDKLCMLIQFHPTFGYEDFIEGLRPTKVDEKKTDGTNNYPLKLQNGVFKSFCKEAGKWEIDLYNENLMPDRSTSEGREAISPLDKPISELEQYRERLLKHGKHWEFIFKMLDSNKTKYGAELLRDVLPPYFLIIDEINRAELSRVFGELMYCLEYRGTDGNVATQYALVNDEKDSMIMTSLGARFFVPTNLYIIGTMNTIDRSVESFDFALRRRFYWEHVKPDEVIAEAYLKSEKCPYSKWAEELLKGWKELNKKISEEKRFMGEDYQIGHAYLMNLKYKVNSARKIREALWNDSIGPLIEEYLRGTEENIDAYKEAFGMKKNKEEIGED